MRNQKSIQSNNLSANALNTTQKQAIKGGTAANDKGDYIIIDIVDGAKATKSGYIIIDIVDGGRA
jgi:hypothetical protein